MLFRSGLPVGWVGAIPRPLPSRGQVAELPAAVQGALVPPWPLRPTRRGGSRAGRVGRQGADPCLPARRQPPRLTPSPTPARSRWPCSGQKLRGKSCTWGPPRCLLGRWGPANLQSREDLWLEGLGQAGVPWEAHRWTDRLEAPPIARPCGLAAVPPRWDGNDVGVGPPSV